MKDYFRQALPDFDAVVLADGAFPQHELPLRILHEAKRLVCCDHALATLLKHYPALVNELMAKHTIDEVGDGDSITTEVGQQFASIIHKVSEQDYNDLTKATRYIHTIIKGHDNRLCVAYLGATGKREDHTIGNIALMDFYRQELHTEPIMLTDWGFFTVHCGNDTLLTFQKQQMSIFNITCTKLESEGLKWHSYAYNALWQGTLNECTGSSVSFKADGRYIVYRTYKAKNKKVCLKFGSINENR